MRATKEMAFLRSSALGGMPMSSDARKMLA